MSDDDDRKCPRCGSPEIDSRSIIFECGTEIRVRVFQSADCRVMELEQQVSILSRWCEGMIEGLQYVANLPEDFHDPLDLKHHALGSLTDAEINGSESICIPAMFRKMFPEE